MNSKRSKSGSPEYKTEIISHAIYSGVRIQLKCQAVHYLVKHTMRAVTHAISCLAFGTPEKFKCAVNKPSGKYKV